MLPPIDYRSLRTDEIDRAAHRGRRLSRVGSFVQGFYRPVIAGPALLFMIKAGVSRRDAGFLVAYGLVLLAFVALVAWLVLREREEHGPAHAAGMKWGTAAGVALFAALAFVMR
jgi:hypothetical protein